jgi:hypothetical protein
MIPGCFSLSEPGDRAEVAFSGCDGGVSEFGLDLANGRSPGIG